MAALRADEEFQRQNTRAAMIVERLGVVDAAVGEGVAQQVSLFQQTSWPNTVPPRAGKPREARFEGPALRG